MSVTDWERVVSVLSDRRKSRQALPHPTRIRHLLSGIARCGLCGNRLRPNPYIVGSPSALKYGHRYQCRASDGGCGGISRVGPPVDELVEAAFLRNTAQPPPPSDALPFRQSSDPVSRTAVRAAEARRRKQTAELAAAVRAWPGLPAPPGLIGRFDQQAPFDRFPQTSRPVKA
ncbi:zinc ribbon domain-containing protein [Streptomyces sp. NPDC051940]|uniref:zinc ribbon domain-containing protein n=1 Tax=Streptomyces sp. NPDC051940 TaxID=3155675 RepID=UPI0034367142